MLTNNKLLSYTKNKFRFNAETLVVLGLVVIMTILPTQSLAKKGDPASEVKNSPFSSIISCSRISSFMGTNLPGQTLPSDQVDLEMGSIVLTSGQAYLENQHTTIQVILSSPPRQTPWERARAWAKSKCGSIAKVTLAVVTGTLVI